MEGAGSPTGYLVEAPGFSSWAAKAITRREVIGPKIESHVSSHMLGKAHGSSEERRHLVSEDHTRDHSFDELTRGLANGSVGRRRALKLFAAGAIAALLPSRALAEPEGEITICHKGKNTITISESAWPAHQAHGDTVGPCFVSPPPF